VSQVNEGQITTYPYDVNTAGFWNGNNAENTMLVNTTHYQYYQLNMNAADTVVWYCLKYDGTPFNDAINDYYIYSKGNVTYSGAGHTYKTSDLPEINRNVSEAQLFVNTMIAAYRVAQVQPKVQFSDESGKKKLENYLLPSDDRGVLSGASSREKLYFTIDDASLGNKTIAVMLSYKGKDGNRLINNLKVYDAQTDQLVPTGGYVSGVTYYVKLSEVWTAMASHYTEAELDSAFANGLEVKIEVTSTVNGSSMSGEASLTLRKLSLFSLS